MLSIQRPHSQFTSLDFQLYGLTFSMPDVGPLRIILESFSQTVQPFTRIRQKYIIPILNSGYLSL